MAKEAKKDDVMSLLESLDVDDGTGQGDKPTNNGQPTQSGPSGDAATSKDEEANVLAFLDEIARQPTNVPSPRPQTPKVRVASGTGASTKPASKRNSDQTVPSVTTNIPITPHEETSGSIEKDAKYANTEHVPGGGWSFGAIFNTASATLKSAEARVREIQASDDAKRLEGMVRSNVNSWGKIGGELRSLGGIGLESVLNTIAPPINKHEVLKVGIYHDMVGYNNIEKIIYSVFERVMEQVEGGELVIQKGKEGKRRDSQSSTEKDFNMCTGLEEASKLAKANVESEAKASSAHASSHASTENPTTVSHIYLSIQAASFQSTSTFSNISRSDKSNNSKAPKDDLFAFVVFLKDAKHDIEYLTVSQAFPLSWTISNHNSELLNWLYEWMDEGLALALGIVAQRYVTRRMNLDDGQDAESFVQRNTQEEEIVAESARVAV